MWLDDDQKQNVIWEDDCYELDSVKLVIDEEHSLYSSETLAVCLVNVDVHEWHAVRAVVTMGNAGCPEWRHLGVGVYSRKCQCAWEMELTSHGHKEAQAVVERVGGHILNYEAGFGVEMKVLRYH